MQPHIFAALQTQSRDFLTAHIEAAEGRKNAPVSQGPEDEASEKCLIDHRGENNRGGQDFGGCGHHVVKSGIQLRGEATACTQRDDQS
jgi:hypothetical protein